MWQNIQGHDTIVERFRRAFQRNRLAGSFLFVGPPGVGKRRFAFALAMALLCKKQDNLNPCGPNPEALCDSCKLFGGVSCTDFAFDTNEDTDGFQSPHPDLYYIAKPPGKESLPMELIIGDDKNRGRSGLCYNIFRTPFLGNRKVAIINDADFLRAEGANALLKTLEEPPPDAVLILVGTSTAKQLPTIRSRCQIVRFSPLPPDVLSAILVASQDAANGEVASRIAVQAEGSLDQAKELADGGIDKLRTEVFQFLSAPHWNAVALANKLNETIDTSAKDLSQKRRQARLIFGLALEHFRSEMKAGNGAAACRRIERTLDALEHVDRNVSVPLIIESWAVDLG